MSTTTIYDYLEYGTYTWEKNNNRNYKCIYTDQQWHLLKIK